MAYTQTDIDRLKAALASPELEVQGRDGSRVRYRSVAELRQVIADAESELAAAHDATRRATHYYTPVLGRER